MQMNPRDIIKNIQRRGLWGSLSLILAVLTCYGTLALVSLLSVLGISMVINEGIWAAAIIMFAVIATAVIAVGMRKHHSLKPLILAIFATGLLIFTMYINYSMLTEVISFVMLAVATYLDFDLSRASSARSSDQ
jgi:arsenite methyltransferase